MHEPEDMPAILQRLHAKLAATDGVQVEFVPESELFVAFKGHRVGSWTPDGPHLTGRFACEGVLLSASSADEAYRLTIGRLG